MADLRFTRINEFGLAVRDVEEAGRLFGEMFLVKPETPVRDTTPGVEIAFGAVSIGGQRLGLLQDSTGRGPVSRFIERRGEGLFNVLIEANDLDAAMAHFRSLGIKFVEDEPRVTRNGEYAGRSYAVHRFAWTRPSTTHGLLIELQEFK